jgi:4-amino-4-deoxy-L-arabinose transferase-like glycosyltransferase
MPAVRRRSLVLLSAPVVVGFVLRMVYLWFARRDACVGSLPMGLGPSCSGDSFVYHFGADLLARGKGFVIPTDYLTSGGSIAHPGADHPPLYTLVLAAFSWVGATSWVWHTFVGVLIGTGNIVLVGLLGRRLGGNLVGSVAAWLMALYPFVWMSDTLVLSESFAMTGLLVVVLLALRVREAPSLANVAWLGVAAGATALIRAEMLLLGPLVIVPVLLFARPATQSVPTPFVRRLSRIALAAAMMIAVISPWVIRNVTTFNHPVTMSTGAGITLANTNCDDTYYGGGLGYWSFRCIGPMPWSFSRDELLAMDPATVAQWARWSGLSVRDDEPVATVVDRLLAHGATADQSDDEVFLRAKGLAYMSDHTTRLPVVVTARVARMWYLYHPLQQIDFEVGEGRPHWAATLGLVAFYPMMLLAAVGVWSQRRSGLRLWILLAPIGIVTFAAASSFGQVRYRAPAEGLVVLLASLGIAALWSRRWPDQGTQPPLGSS